MYTRQLFNILKNRLEEPRKFIQVLFGPRQTGKTTLIQQLLRKIKFPAHYASADASTGEPASWLEQQWETARLRLKQSPEFSEYILVLDEIQKLPSWSAIVKKLWDEDTASGMEIKTVILGSSPWLVQKGLGESLAGRFEMIRVPHWSFSEMHKAFGFSLDQYIFFGGYPGSAGLIKDEQRWKQYIKDTLVETALAKDILLMTRIDKPQVLRRLFELGCRYSGQILSYTKMLGQLQDRGNTTTLAHYLDLLSTAGLLAGLSKYAAANVRQRASIPKLQVFNNALISAGLAESFEEARNNGRLWGQLAESAVGAHLINQTRGSLLDVFYWREKDREVDFILRKGSTLIGIQVKSGSPRHSLTGMEQFTKQFPLKKKLLVGTGGINLKEFFSIAPDELF